MLVSVHEEAGLAPHKVFVSPLLDDALSLGVVGLDVCRVMISDNSFCDRHVLDSLDSIDVDRLIVGLVLRCHSAA